MTDFLDPNWSAEQLAFEAAALADLRSRMGGVPELPDGGVRMESQAPEVSISPVENQTTSSGTGVEEKVPPHPGGGDNYVLVWKSGEGSPEWMKLSCDEED